MGGDIKSMSFQMGSGVGKVAVALLLRLSDLLILSPISDYGVLLFRLIRSCATKDHNNSGSRIRTQGQMLKENIAMVSLSIRGSYQDYHVTYCHFPLPLWSFCLFVCLGIHNFKLFFSLF